MAAANMILVFIFNLPFPDLALVLAERTSALPLPRGNAFVNLVGISFRVMGTGLATRSPNTQC